jgi:hypothetical protein
MLELGGSSVEAYFFSAKPYCLLDVVFDWLDKALPQPTKPNGDECGKARANSTVLGFQAGFSSRRYLANSSASSPISVSVSCLSPLLVRGICTFF